MGDGRRGKNFAVYASVWEFLVMVWVESGGVCRIREIGCEERERKKTLSEISLGMDLGW